MTDLAYTTLCKPRFITTGPKLLDLILECPDLSRECVKSCITNEPFIRGTQSVAGPCTFSKEPCSCGHDDYGSTLT